MLACSSRRALVMGFTAGWLLAGTIASAATSIVLRSGNIAPPAQDPTITFLVEPNNSCTTPFPAAFTAADFAAADAGPQAWSVTPSTSWTASLQCDPAANWISIDQNRKQRSALYSIPFTVDVPNPCCIQYARIYFCWMADDLLGDSGSFPGPNPLGVYLNGVGLPIAGGGYTTEQGIFVDITSTLRCGENRLYVYDRDAGCGVAGAIFTAQIDYTVCFTPAKGTSWGGVRATYHR
ncbi:MAG: hypothetical protein ABI960_01665 [Candidatus Eisenbacteria bacterium]